MRYDNLHWALILLWDRFALDARLNLPIKELLNEVANLLLGKLLGLVERKFLVLDSLLNGEGWPFIHFEVEIAGVSTKGFGVDDSEVDFAFVFLSDGF